MSLNLPWAATSLLPTLAWSPLASRTSTIILARGSAEEPAAAVRGDDRDPVAEVAHVELLGALPGDADGRLGGVGGGHVDAPATVLDVEADRLRGVEGEVQLVAHRVS